MQIQKSKRPVALVTGASAGIGKATALELAQAGYDLILVARRKPELESLAKELIELTSVDVQIKAVDLSAESQVQGLIAEIKSLNVLVNCAAVGKYGPVALQDASDWRLMLDLNCFAMVALSKAAIEKMKNGGTIINISSLAAEIPLAYMAVYSASKAFVTNFSVALNEEVKSQGIRVISLNPGGVRTEFIEKAGIPGQINLDQAHMLVTPQYIARAVVRSIKRPRGIIVPVRSGYLAQFALWLLPRPVKARLAAVTYRKYLG